MARAKIPQLAIQALTGTALVNASVLVVDRDTASPIVETLYADKTGGTTVVNPIAASARGDVLAYLAVPRMVDLVVSAPGYATYTIPDVAAEVDTSDLVTAAGTQTLTNKTLTSPTITGGTLSGTNLAGSDISTAVISGVSIPAARGLESLFEQAPLNFLHFGGNGLGIVDDGVKMQQALDICKAANRPLYMPRGTYNFITRPTLSLAVGPIIFGDGQSLTNITGPGTADLMTLNCCQRGVIKGIAFYGNVMTAGDGLVIKSDGVNSPGGQMAIIECQFASFPGRGLYLHGLTGVLGNMSGAMVRDNIFLSNGILSGTAQFKALYSQDSHTEDNEFGWLGTGSRSTIGSEMEYCSAGNYYGNYHWEQGTYAALFTNSGQVRNIGNRYETNRRVAVKMSGCDSGIFTANTVHTNSMESTGVYNAMEMVNSTDWGIEGNSYQTWDAGIQVLNYITMDAGSTGNRIHNNQFEIAGRTGADWTGTPASYGGNTDGGVSAGIISAKTYLRIDSPDGAVVKYFFVDNAGKLLIYATNGSTLIGGLTDAGVLSLPASAGGLVLGASAGKLTGVLIGSTTWDPANLIFTAIETKDVTVTGAAVGDFVAATLSSATIGWVLYGMVTATNTVRVTLCNMTGATSDLGSGTLRVMVTKAS